MIANQKSEKPPTPATAVEPAAIPIIAPVPRPSSGSSGLLGSGSGVGVDIVYSQASHLPSELASLCSASSPYSVLQTEHFDLAVQVAVPPLWALSSPVSALHTEHLALAVQVASLYLLNIYYNLKELMPKAF